MDFFIQFFVIIPIFSTTIVPNSEIDKNNKRFAALEQEIQTLRQKNITATVKICNQNVIAWNLNNMVSK